MSKLDIAEKRKPQDGKIRFRGPMGSIELRVATIPTSGGNEDVVMRILAASKPMPEFAPVTTQRRPVRSTSRSAGSQASEWMSNPVLSNEKATVGSTILDSPLPSKRRMGLEEPSFAMGEAPGSRGGA